MVNDELRQQLMRQMVDEHDPSRRTEIASEMMRKSLEHDGALHVKALNVAAGKERTDQPATETTFVFSFAGQMNAEGEVVPAHMLLSLDQATTFYVELSKALLAVADAHVSEN